MRARDQRQGGGLATDSKAVTPVAALVTIALLGSALPASAQVSCGDRIEAGQEVVLAGDLECDDFGGGLTIEGPAVLDLNGFSIRCVDRNGDGRLPLSGIAVFGAGAVVRGGTVNGCRQGLEIAGEGRHRIEDVTALFNAGDGMRVASDRNQIIDSFAFGSGGDGFSIEGSSNRVEGNNGTNSGELGFRIFGRNTVVKNIASDNPSAGFLVAGKSSVLNDNRAIGNVRGFAVIGQKNRFVGNEAENNTTGFFLDGPAKGNLLTRNIMTGNDSTGLLAIGDGNRLSRNRAERNGSFGIQLLGVVSKTIIIANTARANGETDLVDESADCSTNRWRDNTFGSSNQPCIE